MTASTAESPRLAGTSRRGELAQVAETAELPLVASVGATVHVGPGIGPAVGTEGGGRATGGDDADPRLLRGPDRIALRQERQRERRRRRLFALVGLAVLVLFLAATVAVLDVVR